MKIMDGHMHSYVLDRQTRQVRRPKQIFYQLLLFLRRDLFNFIPSIYSYRLRFKLSF
jgi:hypothetical protein